MEKIKTVSLINNVRTYFKANQYQSAQKLLEAALETDSRNEHLHFWLGKSHLHQHNFPESLAEFNLTLEINPHHAEALICLVATYCDLGRYQDGMEIYNKLVQQHDPTTDLNKLAMLKLKEKHVACGDLYLELGKKTAALQEYQKALLLDQQDGDCRLQLAVSCYFATNLDRAQAEIASVLATDPDHFEALLWSGLCFYKREDRERASEQWEKARRLIPTEAKVKSLIRMNA